MCVWRVWMWRVEGWRVWGPTRETSTVRSSSTAQDRYCLIEMPFHNMLLILLYTPSFCHVCYNPLNCVVGYGINLWCGFVWLLYPRPQAPLSFFYLQLAYKKKGGAWGREAMSLIAIRWHLWSFALDPTHKLVYCCLWVSWPFYGAWVVVGPWVLGIDSHTHLGNEQGHP